MNDTRPFGRRRIDCYCGIATCCELSDSLTVNDVLDPEAGAAAMMGCKLQTYYRGLVQRGGIFHPNPMAINQSCTACRGRPADVSLLHALLCLS